MSKARPMTYTCRVITAQEAEGRSVIQMAFGSTNPAFVGEGAGRGDLTMLCGACGRTIVQTVAPGTLTRVIIRCGCYAYNDTDMI